MPESIRVEFEQLAEPPFPELPIRVSVSGRFTRRSGARFSAKVGRQPVQAINFDPEGTGFVGYIAARPNGGDELVLERGIFTVPTGARFSAPGSAQELEGYSRPLYDAGEHVLAGSDLYPDQLRVGQEPGVRFSYGELIAMADLYESVHQMAKADVAELKKIKSHMQSTTAYYGGKKANPSLDVSDEMWDAATRDRYLELAEENYEHFSPNTVFKNAQFGARKHGNHEAAWKRHHRLAIEEAQRLFLQRPNVSYLPEWPLIVNAFGDHFLTDAFAAGHVINKEEITGQFMLKFFERGKLRPEAEKFFERVAKLAFKGEVRRKFSVLETYKPVFLWWNPNIDTENAFRKLLVGIAEQRPDQIANLAVKALHDHLNKVGVQVSNGVGNTWTLKGDGYLMGEHAQDKLSLEIMKKAVRQSAASITDPAIRASNLNFEAFFAKVWQYVPRLTPESQNTVNQLATDYTRPDSAALTTAAAAIIERKVNLLIKKLKAEKKLKDA